MRPKRRNPIPQDRPRREDRLEKPWETQEKEGARIIRGERTRGSGSGKEKGDAKGRFHRLEAKTTDKDSIRIEMEYLCKISQEADNALKTPVLQFGFDRMPVLFSADWFAMPAEKFDALCGLMDAVFAGDIEEAQRCLRHFHF